jgi:peptidyl-prolyl cis-trans isomerase D
MLLQFRKLTRGAIAAGILGLVGLATVLFLPSGASFNVGPSNDLASVGRYSITPPQLSREMELTLRGQRAQGANVTTQEAIDAGLHTRLLEAMIARLSFYSYADKLGVSASDRQVGDRIREIPRVSNPITGQFDREAYASFLRELGYPQQEFERDIRGDLTNQMLIDAMVAGARPPSSFGALELVYRAETRLISIAEAGAGAAGAIPQPTEAQLQDFYQDNQEALRVPEYRTVTLVVARPEDFVARVQVPDARLTQEVEARRASVAAPEKRTFVRITATSQQQADAAAARVNAGEAPAAVAQALGLQMARGENQTRAEVTDPRVAEAVFALGAGAPARVVRGQLAPFVVVRVESITAAAAPNMEELRTQVRQQIAIEEAANLLHAAIDAYEEARAGGATPAEAARANGLPFITIPAVDEQGRDQQGQEVIALQGFAEALRSAFEMNEGEASDFIPADNGDVMISVDTVIPASVRAFADVREQLLQGWIARERAQRLQALGREVTQAVAGGQSFEAAARAHGMTIVLRAREVDREGIRQIPARGLGAQIFNARQGEAVADMRVDGGAVLVAVVERINRPNPAEQPQLVEAARVQSQQVVQTAIVQAIQAQVVDRMHPNRNTRLLERTFRPSSTEDETGS